MRRKLATALAATAAALVAWSAVAAVPAHATNPCLDMNMHWGNIDHPPCT